MKKKGASLEDQRDKSLSYKGVRFSNYPTGLITFFFKDRKMDNGIAAITPLEVDLLNTYRSIISDIDNKYSMTARKSEKERYLYPYEKGDVMAMK